MAGVMNNTARQFNLKTIGANGNRVLVRLAPGFNSVNDDHWKSFVPGGSKKNNPYVQKLKDSGQIDFGAAQDDKEMEVDPDTKSKSKSEPRPKKTTKSE